MTFPNVDGLAPGERRPIFSFDHDLGDWVLTGQAIVSDDGERLITDDGGVNTLGWKTLGKVPGTVDRPLFNDDEPLPNSDNDHLPDSIDPDNDNDGIPDEEEAVEYLVTLRYGASYEYQPLLIEGNVGFEIPDFRMIFGLDAEEIQPLSLGFELPIPEKPVSGGFQSREQFRVNEFVGDLIPDFDTTLFHLEASVGVSAAVGIFGAVDFTGGESEFEIEDVVGRPGNINIEGELRISKSWLCRIPFDIGEKICEPIMFSKTVFGAPDVDPLIPDQDIDLPLGLIPVIDYNGEFSIGASVSASTSLDISPSISLQKRKIPATVQELQFPPANNIAAVVADIGVSLSSSVMETNDVHFLYEFSNGITHRSTTQLGSIPNVIAPEGTIYNLYAFAPGSNRYAITSGVISSGLARNQNPVSLDHQGGLDFDRDGLIDIGEYVIGTSQSVADSDGDGLSDLAELQQGLNPLDGIGFPTGIIASLPLLGEAQDILMAASLSNPNAQHAYLATGSHGLAIVDASQFNDPIVLGCLDLPGTSVAVEINDGQTLAYVAASGAGLHIIDISDPLEPRLQQTIREFGSITQIERVDDAIALAGSSLFLLDAITGDLLLEAELEDQAGRLTDLQFRGGILYAISGNQRLHTLQFDGDFLTDLDNALIPTPPYRRVQPEAMRLFVARGIAYVSNGLEVQSVSSSRPLERGGYLTFDVSDPREVSLISDIDTADFQAGNLQTILNGSGLALVAGGFRGLEIHSASNPEVTYDLITQFETAGPAKGVANVGGIAYVAADHGGLQVINYLDFDPHGMPPTVSISVDAVDKDPDTEGIQVEEGTTLRISPSVMDDVQVRGVELLINGTVVSRDISFPYDLAIPVPNLDLGTDHIEIQVRAMDTGGNTGESEIRPLQIIPDVTLPELLSTRPKPIALLGIQTPTLSFSESLNTSLIDQNAIWVTRDNLPEEDLVPVAFGFRGDDRIVDASLAEGLGVGEYQLHYLQSAFQDRAGNAFGDEVISVPFKVVEATAFWDAPQGGDWNTPSNWLSGEVPGPDDAVLAILDEGAEMTLRSGIANVEKLTVLGRLVLNGGTLEADYVDAREAEIVIERGTVRNAVIDGNEDIAIPITSTALTLDGVTLNSNAHIDASTGHRTVTVQNGLTLNGTLALAGADTNNATLSFSGGVQNVDGEGTIVFAGHPSSPSRNQMNILNATAEADSVIFGEGIEIHGGTGTIRSNAEEGFVFHGQLVGDSGGNLVLSNVFNARVPLVIDAPEGGISLSGTIQETVLQSSAGSSMNLDISQVQVLDGVTLNGHARIDGGTRSRLVRVENGLTLNGTLTLAGGTTSIQGATLSTVNDGITFHGDHGTIEGNNDDKIVINTTLTGEAAGELRLSGIEGQLTINDPMGGVIPNGSFNGVTFDLAEGQELDISEVQMLHRVTLNGNAKIDGGTRSRLVRVENGLTLNGTLTLAGGTDNLHTVMILFQGEQSFGGNGSVIFSNEYGTEAAFARNTFSFLDALAGTQRLTVNDGITFHGDEGSIEGTNNDKIVLNTTLTGESAGNFRLSGIEGQLTINDPMGGVIPNGSFNGVTFNLAEDQELDISEVQVLNGVTLNGHARIDGGTRSRLVRVENGLTLNGNLTLAGGIDNLHRVNLHFQGEQTLEGEGSITFSSEYSTEEASPLNSMSIADTAAEAEVVTIGPDIILESGAGDLTASSSDRFQLNGTMISRLGNRMEIAGLNLTPTSRLIFEAEGANLGQHGTVHVKGDFILGGAVGIIPKSGYVASVGHTLDLITFSNTATGSFSASANTGATGGNSSITTDIDVENRTIRIRVNQTF